MTKAIIFDLDGLLVNTEIISFNIYRDLLCDYGKTFTIDDYTKSYSGNPSDVNLTNITKIINYLYLLMKVTTKSTTLNLNI